MNWKLRYLGGRMCTGFKWLRRGVIGQLLGYFTVETGQELQTFEARVIIISPFCLLFRATNVRHKYYQLIFIS